MKNIDIDLDFTNALREFHDSLSDGDFLFCLARRKDEKGEEEGTHVAYVGNEIQLQQTMTNDFINHMRKQKESTANYLEDMREIMFVGVAMSLALDKNLEKVFMEDLERLKETIKKV